MEEMFEEREPEIWKPISGYEGLYEVSSWGNVKSLPKEWGYNRSHNGFFSSLKKEKKGYLRVCLSKNGKAKRFQVHRLVAQAFIPNPDNYQLVLHGDDNPANNYYKNLRWGDEQMNSDDKYLRGREIHLKGERVGTSKLTEQQVLDIRAKYTGAIGEQIKLSKEYGVNPATIRDLLFRKTWKHI